MHVYDSFDTFWSEYFGKEQTNTGFDAWAIAHVAHTSDAEYAALTSAGKDTLGYQPTMFTLADPLKQRYEEVIVKDLRSAQVAAIQEQYRKRFVEQMPQRFGLFHSDKKQADAIYKNFDDFAREWIERSGTSTLPYNLPLLFDHVSDAAYWGWRQKGFDPCGTQRLIVTVFQYRTGKFAEVFVTDVTDTEMARITVLMQSKITLQIEDIV